MDAFEASNFRVTLIPEPETYALMLAGLGVVGLVVNFLLSPEFRTGTQARLNAFLLYATLLNRDPSSAELKVFGPMK